MTMIPRHQTRLACVNQLASYVDAVAKAVISGDEEGYRRARDAAAEFNASVLADLMEQVNAAVADAQGLQSEYRHLVERLEGLKAAAGNTRPAPLPSEVFNAFYEATTQKVVCLLETVLGQEQVTERAHLARIVRAANEQAGGAKTQSPWAYQAFERVALSLEVADASKSPPN